MAKYMEIETKNTEQIVLYEREEFDNAREQAVKAIDAMVSYLQSIREDVATFEPNDVYCKDPKFGRYTNGITRNNVLDQIRDTIYTPGHEEHGEYYEHSGRVANVLDRLYEVRYIGWNLYYQERYSGEIEEHRHHFR